MVWSIDRNATIAFGVGLALMFVSFALTYSVTAEMEASAQWVAHTHEVRFHNSKLVSILQDMETGQRGYLLTGQESFLEPYLSATKALPAELLTLRGLTIDNPSQQIRLQALEPLMTARVEFAAQMVTTYRAQGPVAASDIFRTGKGRLLSEEIRARLTEVDGEEARLEQLRDAKSKAAVHRAFFILPLGGLFSVAILAAALFLLNREVFKQKRLAEDFSRLAAIVQSSDDAIISKDLKNIVTSWNIGAERLFGFTADEMVGTSIMLLIPSERQDEENSILGKIAHSESVEHFESVRLTKDGRRIDVSITASPIKDAAGKIIGASKIARDISDQKRAEAALRESEAEIRRLNATLEQRVAERTAQLEISNKELEAFSYSVSHDLRSPLRGVNGYVRMLKEDYADRLDAEGNRLLDVVCSEATRMGRLIDDLLAFSRVGREKMESTNIDITNLVRIEFESQTKAAPESAPRLDLQALPSARADYSMMRQVFANLIGNAIKFTRHQPSPVIEVGCTNQAGERVYYVKDNGVGFDQQYVHKLFGVFQRLHSTKEFEGTGIGLSLVQRIIQRHGGKIWAEGKLNQGAAFYFTLPT